MRLIAVVVIWLLPLALLVAAAVWAVNLSGSVYAIQRTLERMDARQAAAVQPLPAASVTAPPARGTDRTESDPIDIDPFVE